MTLERGGLNLPLLEELVAAGASSAELSGEGYTPAETIRARIASALRSTSDTVSIGQASDVTIASLSDLQPRQGDMPL